VQTLFFLDKTTVQLIVTPFPRNNKVPGAGDAFDPFYPGRAPLPISTAPEFKLDRFGRDAEFGGRVSHLFESGVDLGLLYYRHWNRNAVYAYQPAAQNAALGQDDGAPACGGCLVPVIDRVHTLGTTVSKAFEQLVVRADSIVNLGQPYAEVVAADLVVPQKRTEVQSIVGADWTTRDQTTFGAQLHGEWTAGRTQEWASIMMGRKWLSDKVDTSVFAFRGLDNDDFWVQPKLTWNVNTRFSASLRVDLVGGAAATEDGVFSAFRDQDRFFTWVSYRF
jgi:hypothetical protein